MRSSLSELGSSNASNSHCHQFSLGDFVALLYLCHHLFAFLDSPRTFDEAHLTSVIHRHISGAELLSNEVSEITYQLPSEGARDGGFQQLFRFLDENLVLLGVSSYGLTDTSLEEVILVVDGVGDLCFYSIILSGPCSDWCREFSQLLQLYYWIVSPSENLWVRFVWNLP